MKHLRFMFYMKHWAQLPNMTLPSAWIISGCCWCPFRSYLIAYNCCWSAVRMPGDRVLVIGSGGREHAIAWKLSFSKSIGTVIVAPGNAGTQTSTEGDGYRRKIRSPPGNSWLFIFLSPTSAWSVTSVQFFIWHLVYSNAISWICEQPWVCEHCFLIQYVCF